MYIVTVYFVKPTHLVSSKCLY